MSRRASWAKKTKLCLKVLKIVIKLTEHTLYMIKLKVKFSLRLTKHHAMKTYWESGGIAPCVLDLGTRWR
jgi:hypothetical protein